MTTLKTSRNTERRKRATACIRHVRITMGCQSCKKETNPTVLELHHVIPIGKNRTRNYQSLTILEKDLALCVVVCANCHLRIGAGEKESPPAMGIEKARSFTDLFRKETTYRRGFDHVGTALTQTQVDEIRLLHPRLSYNQIAKQFGVTKNTIVKAVKRRSPYTT